MRAAGPSYSTSDRKAPPVAQFTKGAATLLAIGTLASGCSIGAKTMDHKSVETAITTNLKQQGTVLTSIKCPSGQKAKANVTFYCDAVLAGGVAKKVKVVLQDDKGHFLYQVQK